MSKGSPIVPLRIPEEVLAEIDAKVSRSLASGNDPHTRSSWILAAIREKLAHLKRGNRRTKHKESPCESPEPSTPSPSAPSA